MKIRTHVIAALAALVILPVALTAQEGKAKGKNSPFMAADTDKDGKISSAEFVAYASAKMSMSEEDAKKKFAELDTDKDGFLTREEFRAGMPAGKKKADSDDKK